jgi:hypothetical protein
MVMVIRTDGSKEHFNRNRIINAILQETKLCEELFGHLLLTWQMQHLSLAERRSWLKVLI